MNIEEKVYCYATSEECTSIRTLLCTVAKNKYDQDYNPLIKTAFNDILAKIVQDAFYHGRSYERNKLK